MNTPFMNLCVTAARQGRRRPSTVRRQHGPPGRLCEAARANVRSVRSCIGSMARSRPARRAAARPSAAAAPATALVDAARTGDAQAVRALLRQKAVDVNAAGADGTTPLHWAVQRDDDGWSSCCSAPAPTSQAPNRYGVQPLALAAVNGNAGNLDAAARGRRRSERRRCPRGETRDHDRGAHRQASTRCKLLIAHGAQTSTPGTARGQTALMWAAARNNADAVRAAGRGGADIDGPHQQSAAGRRPRR